jgi:predicted DNA-binding transcriptional regulator AlpA
VIARLVTVEDYAELLRTTPTAIRRLRERGTLPPAIKVGVRVLWDPDVVERWLAEQREDPR